MILEVRLHPLLYALFFILFILQHVLLTCLMHVLLTLPLGKKKKFLTSYKNSNIMQQINPPIPFSCFCRVFLSLLKEHHTKMSICLCLSSAVADFYLSTQPESFYLICTVSFSTFLEMSVEQNTTTENGSSSLGDYSQHSPDMSTGQIQQYAMSLLHLLSLQCHKEAGS